MNKFVLSLLICCAIVRVSHCAGISLRGSSSSSRSLQEDEATLREERKQKKRDHWKLTQFMDYGEKVKDAFTRRDAYERREKEKEKRVERWEKGEEIDNTQKRVEEAYKNKQLMKRREAGKQDRIDTFAKTGHATDWQKKAERIAAKTAGQPMVNLEDVTTEQLTVLFEELSFFNCDDELRRNKVDGAALSQVKDHNDFEKKHMLILPTSAAKILYSKIDEFRSEGVPKNLLKELPEIHSHLLKKNDNTKKVYCQSSKPDEYQDGATAPFAYIP